MPQGCCCERLRDGCSAPEELRVQLLDPGNGQIRVEMLFRLSVGALRLELRRALQVDDGAVAGDARRRSLRRRSRRRTRGAARRRPRNRPASRRGTGAPPTVIEAIEAPPRTNEDRGSGGAQGRGRPKNRTSRRRPRARTPQASSVSFSGFDIRRRSDENPRRKSVGIRTSQVASQRAEVAAGSWGAGGSRRP